MQKKISITETPNEITNDIDIASVMGIIRILRQTDAQIFFGWRHYAGLRDVEILNKIEKCVDETAKVLKQEKGKVLISGAGTSGRLGMFVSRKFNALLKKYGHAQMFDYVMAGTDKALIKAQEGAEDDAVQSVIDYKNIAGDATHTALYGVTCGFSAPYIAGQIDFAMQNKNIFPCLLGFNPVELSRNIEIEKWNKTFFQVASAFEKFEGGVILNPIAGPEPITGSTRMKGGSATKLLLELIFTLSCIKSGRIPAEGIAMKEIKNSESTRKSIVKIIDCYEEAMKATYNAEEQLEKIVSAAGEVIKSDGHIYYLGEAPLGIIGLVDASECPPTYGANFDDVRGFLDGGWDTLLGDGKDISHISPEYHISIDDFKKEVLPKLKKNDIVIALAYAKLPKKIKKLIEKSKSRGAQTGAIILNSQEKDCANIDYIVNVDYKPASPLAGDISFVEYSLKLVVNAITTAAHIMDGKIYQNRMIDLKISNNKLFYRCIGIIAKITGADEEFIRKSVIKSIFETDELTDEQLNAPISQYVNAATPKSKVVPRALLLSTGKFNVKQATEKIKEEPVVRNIIENIILK